MTCAWTAGGAVFCQDHGPLYAVEGLHDAVELATDPDALLTCARRRTGRVACWSALGKHAPVKDVGGVEGALEIAVAGSTACIRDKDGVACWPGGWVDAEPVAKLRRIPQAEGATRLAGGRHKFVALIPGEPPVGWQEAGYKPFELPVLGGGVTQIAIGGDDACALGPAGVRCWRATDVASIHDLPGLAGAQEIAVGRALACARLGTRLACWGSIGSLGDGLPLSTDLPVVVDGLTDAKRIAIAGERACARRAGGQIVCWGERADGGSDPVPAPIPGVALPGDSRCGAGTRCGAGVTRVWAGASQRGRWSCAKAETVSCTLTFHGRHGETDTAPEGSWGDLDHARDIRMPSNLLGSVCVADEAGTVACFSAFSGVRDAATVDGVEDAKALAEYGEDTCAIVGSGRVKCWNERERRYLGATVRTLPGITDATEIVGGEMHACVRHRSGKVSCWGFRTLLGDAVDRFQRTPKILDGVAL
jgi:hypothetical protein